MNRSLATLAIVFLAAHVVFLPPTLEDIDSVNFALGVRDFDVAHHQPHPPGYPVFIALGKVSTPVLRLLGVPGPEPRGLAIWSALAGAAALLMVFAAARLHGPERRAAWTTVLVAVCPLFWFTALRPLSDMCGLAAVLTAQALIIPVLLGRGSPRKLILAGLIAGLAIGIRSQTFLLTLPLLGAAVAWPGSGFSLRDRLTPIAAAAAGALLWGIPLILSTGGLNGYLAALGSQAAEDFSGVVMLWTTRTRPAVLDAAMFSFLWPWGHPVVGGIVVAAACLGAIRLAWTAPRALVVVLVAFVPYAVFHLLLQETATVRYALPLVVPTAYLVATALDGIGRVALAVGGGALAMGSLAMALPATVAYGRTASPVFQALDGVRIGSERVDAVGVHAVNRRAAEWAEGTLPGRVLKAPHGVEWLTLVDLWRSQPGAVVSFVADPRRTDLVLFDPTARLLRGRFTWPFVEPPFVGGARPGNTDWYVMHAPGWMLARGWALTAEVAGITARDGWGPHRRPSTAWVRTRPDAAVLAIGGRHLGAAADPPVRVRLTLDGRALETFDVGPGFFLKVFSLTSGALVGNGAYVPLAVTSESADGSRREIAVALEQFDLQPAGVPMVGVDEGWQEQEYDRRTSRSWRWMSERATTWVRPVGRDVILALSGESPLRYYGAPSTLTISIGGRQIAQFAPASDFTQEIVLPASALESADGRVVIESSKWFVPAERDGSQDRRHLALRIYSLTVK